MHLLQHFNVFALNPYNVHVAPVRLSSTDNTEKAEEQPDRVVIIEDLRPFLFSLSQPASLRWVARLKLLVVDSIARTALVLGDR